MLQGVIQKSTLLCLMALCLATTAFGQYNQDFKNRLAPFVTSPQRAVDKMLEMANLKPGETLYDLGCRSVPHSAPNVRLVTHPLHN